MMWARRVSAGSACSLSCGVSWTARREMNVKQKWFTYTVAVCAAVICVQLAASYAIALWAAHFGASRWLRAALWNQVASADNGLSRRLAETVDFIAQSPELITANPEQVEKFMRARFATRPEAFWAWIPRAPAAVATSEPLCEDALRRLRVAPQNTPSFFACGERAVLAARATVAGGNADLVIGDVVGPAYARDVHDASMAEVLVFVGDTPIGTTLEDEAGAMLPVPVRPSELFASRDDVTTPVTERRLVLPGYAGYELSGDGARPRERLPVSANDVWYVAGQRVSVADDIVVVFLVPRVFLTTSARYDLELMSGISLILLIVMGLLVWRIVSRFSDPIATLSASAHAVSQGDLTQPVPVPDDTEMGEFCRTYNTMLGSMRDLMVLQKRLAREAGRSEIATGVLHNVGNVLNSINVAASLALETVRESKVTNLRKAVLVLDEHAGDLPAFLAADTRGQKLPAYLSKLSVHLLEERDRTAAELGGLVKSVEHIRTIVSMQQAYAKKVGGVAERCTLADVVDDALRIEATSLQNHHIEVVREVDAAPELSIDKHKALQILVNLLSNAKNAIVATARGAGSIVVRCDADTRHVWVDIIDDGVGIVEEDRTRIFSLGFTTSATGHGFGLHNSANAAKEMGGALRGVSPGRGRGATFTLELPAQ